jgi:hypothetical protein
MKKFKDGSVMYEPYERLTYLERIQDLFKLLSILPSLLFKRNGNNNQRNQNYEVFQIN